jgi:hypothetical protein
LDAIRIKVCAQNRLFRHIKERVDN